MSLFKPINTLMMVKLLNLLVLAFIPVFMVHGDGMMTKIQHKKQNENLQLNPEELSRIHFRDLFLNMSLNAGDTIPECQADQKGCYVGFIFSMPGRVDEPRKYAWYERPLCKCGAFKECKILQSKLQLPDGSFQDPYPIGDCQWAFWFITCCTLLVICTAFGIFQTVKSLWRRYTF